MSDYRNREAVGATETVQDPAERGSNRVSYPLMGTIVNAPFVKIRRGPSPSAETVTNKRKGDRVKVLADAEDYYKIIAFGEVEGYIRKAYIHLEK